MRRCYTALLFAVALACVGTPRLVAADAQTEGDPEATRLLAEARAARAQWSHFPGFRADVEVNLEGKVVRGHVEVKSSGKLQLDLDTREGNREAESWVRRELGSLVAHRLDGSSDLHTPCVFTDDNADYPLGRSIRVLTDEFHSSYRIADRQIRVVNRQMPDSGVRFTITVLENQLTEDRKFLPTFYTVNTWDLKTGALTSADTHHDSWERVGHFDLPASILVVTARADKQEARSLKLSHHQLLEEP